MDEINKTVPVTTADATAESATDVHQATYTTTPLQDRVSSANQGLGAAVNPEMPDPGKVTEQFDHLATRDPAAMEHQLQTPEFAGAQTTAGLIPGGHVATAVVNPDNLSVMTVGNPAIDAGIISPGLTDANPHYTAPAQSGPPHVHEQPGDLPSGVPEELVTEVKGRG